MTYWSAWTVGFLLVLVFPAVAVLAQIGIRRAWPRLAEGEHNEVAGFIIAVVGVIYAVLLAFVVIVSWEKFNSAESVVGEEASALRSIYRESVAFPPETRTQLDDDVGRYADAVIKQEWPAMAEGQAGHPAVAQVLDEMALHLAALPATTPTQQEFVGAEAARFNDLVSSRSQRLDYVDQGVSGMLWLALIVGAVVTIGFATIFGLRSAALHIVITGSLAVTIGVLLFVAVVIDRPFGGGATVEPRPLERVVTDFGGPE
jgi:Protein of unknown function (DUF4239)